MCQLFIQEHCIRWLVKVVHFKESSFSIFFFLNKYVFLSEICDETWNRAPVIEF